MTPPPLPLDATLSRAEKDVAVARAQLSVGLQDASRASERWATTALWVVAGASFLGAAVVVALALRDAKRRPAGVEDFTRRAVPSLGRLALKAFWSMAERRLGGAHAAKAPEG